MSELKPCPFCGGKVKLMAIAGEPYPPQYEVNLDEVNEQSDDICFVHCPACGANWHIERRIDSFPLDTIRAWNRRAQPAACEIAEYAEDCKDCGFCAQPANEPLTKISEMLEQAAQDMDDKCRQWQCVLQRVHDTGTFDQNSGLWVGIDKEREAKAQANFEAYRYSLGVIDKIAEHVSNPYKSAHKPGGEHNA